MCHIHGMLGLARRGSPSWWEEVALEMVASVLSASSSSSITWHGRGHQREDTKHKHACIYAEASGGVEK